jgi:hypothetical protein
MRLHWPLLAPLFELISQPLFELAGPFLYPAQWGKFNADARLVEEIDRDLLYHAGADAAEHMLAGMPLDNDVIDALVMQELAEQKARQGLPAHKTLRAFSLKSDYRI